jgi:hypothetical protein
MLKIHLSSGSRPSRHHRFRDAFLLLLACLCPPYAPLQAQDLMPGMSPWAGFGSPMSQSAFPSLPYPSGTGPAMPSGFATPFQEPLYDAWRLPRSTRPGPYADSGPVDSYQPDLTGNWRGSGGETVEIQRNRARIWGGSHQSCSCVFFIVGRRLIAYSPDSDRVRKYWYQGQHDRFSLIDEEGNLLSFWRVR